MTTISLATAGELASTAGAMMWSGIDREADYFNRRWCEFTGLSEPESIAGGWHVVLGPQETTNVLDGVARFAGRLRDALGNFRLCTLHVTTADGRWYCTANEHEPQLRDELLRRLYHDLGTPLSTLLLWEQVLRMNGNDPQARGQALDAIRISARMQAAVLDDFNDASRALAGTLQIARTRIELATLVHAAIERARFEATTRQLEISETLAHGLEVSGDRKRLDRVLDNLLSRVLSRSLPAGVLSVVLRRCERDGVIELRSAPQRELTADASLLQLIAARELITLHGGTLADSDSTTTIQLPLA